MVGAAANAVILFAYSGIAYIILMGPNGVFRQERWHENVLALFTGLIFVSCAVGHGLHLNHLLEPGLLTSNTAVAREAWDWHLAIWDLLTAGIAVIYFSMRNRFPVLVRGAALFEDMTVRRKQALEIHDNVVQGLATTKLAFELGDDDQGMAELEATLEEARRISSKLLGDEHLLLVPGSLVRRIGHTLARP